ncbi:MAG: D-amino-acid transaminase [Parvularculaceae bacterium]|nr:D-amino-acid transaminase [Parvularculaceae bacterium]
MSDRIFYVNGSFVPESEAKISVLDRGFLFADGVYEVSAVIDGQLIDNAAHLARLERSLQELDMQAPCSPEEIERIQQRLITENKLVEGVIYLQVTRGAADRDFGFPEHAEPSLVMFTQVKRIVDNPVMDKGIRVISVEDIRWKRRDIKTVGLLAPVLAKQEAKTRGADDAWMVEDGFVTEGSSNNAFIVTAEGTIVTRRLGNEILHGITRHVVLELAAKNDLKVEERNFTIEEAQSAEEAFVTSASLFVMPVVEIDGKRLGTGEPGPLVRQLRDLYLAFARRGL